MWWDSNAEMSPEHFATLRADMTEHMKGREYFVQDLYGGADPAHRLDVRVVTELAWHSLFIRHLLRRPAASELAGFEPEFTVLNCPSFQADPERHGSRSEVAIALNLEEKIVLICGTEYAGENKKSVFTLLNWLLPAKGVMPIALLGQPRAEGAHRFGGVLRPVGDGQDDPVGGAVAHADRRRRARLVRHRHLQLRGRLLRQDDQPKSSDAEPEIFATTSRFATVVENMVFDPDTLELDFEDDSITANTRCAYPLEAISNASETGLGGHPGNVVMLTCDAYGVLPPIARLTPAQAMYHFLSGFTSKVAGTERGVTEPQPTFSTCFGAPFLPRRPEVYGAMLQDKIARHGSDCWLVNTGWTGGAYGTGSRMPIKATRALLTSALSGKLAAGAFRTDPNFGFDVPVTCEGVPDVLLDPRRTWADKDAYDAQARKLVGMFSDNFAQYVDHIDDDVRACALG